MRSTAGLLTRLVLILLLPAPLLLASPSAATTVTFGPADAGLGNFVPWNSVGPGRYQQIYSSSLFSGPISISQISFFNNEKDPGTADISEGNYSLHLSTTTVAVDALDSAIMNNNVGGDDATFFSGTLGAGGAFGLTFTINGTAFSYDPVGGNLLLDLFINSVAAQGSGFLDCKDCNDVGADDASSRAYSFELGVGADSIGLVTRFSDQVPQVPQVPAPASLALLSLGLVAVVARLHRRR